MSTVYQSVNIDCAVLLYYQCNVVIIKDYSKQLRESTETSSNGLLYFLANVACAQPISQSEAFIFECFILFCQLRPLYNMDECAINAVQANGLIRLFSLQ